MKNIFTVLFLLVYALVFGQGGVVVGGTGNSGSGGTVDVKCDSVTWVKTVQAPDTLHVQSCWSGGLVIDRDSIWTGGSQTDKQAVLSITADYDLNTFSGDEIAIDFINTGTGDVRIYNGIPSPVTVNAGKTASFAKDDAGNWVLMREDESQNADNVNVTGGDFAGLNVEEALDSLNFVCPDGQVIQTIAGVKTCIDLSEEEPFRSAITNKGAVNGDADIWYGGGKVGIGYVGNQVSSRYQLSVLGKFWLSDSNNNAIVGMSAGSNNTGSNGAIFGDRAGRNNTGNANFIGGFLAGDNNTGNNNLLFGTESGFNNVNNDVIAIGRRAAYNQNVSLSNGTTNIGAFSGFESTASGSINIGRLSGYSNSGIDAINIGANAGKEHSGKNTVAIGVSALEDALGDIDQSVYIGLNSGKDANGGLNVVAIGKGTLQNNQSDDMVAIGADALNSNTTGIENVAIGHDAGLKNTTGSYNTYAGWFAAAQNNGDSNVQIGESANDQAIDGNENVLVGRRVFHDNGHGSRTVSIGEGAGYFSQSIYVQDMVAGDVYRIASEDAIAQGTDFTTLGASSNQLKTVFTYNGNTVSGTARVRSENAANAPDENVFVGARAAEYNGYGKRNVYVGYRAASSSDYTHQNDKLVIANDDTITPLVGGDFANKQLGINTNPMALSATLDISSSGNTSATIAQKINNSDDDEIFKILDNGNLILSQYDSPSSFPVTPIGTLVFDNQGNIGSAELTPTSSSHTLTHTPTNTPVQLGFTGVEPYLVSAAEDGKTLTDVLVKTATPHTDAGGAPLVVTIEVVRAGAVVSTYTANIGDTQSDASTSGTFVLAEKDFIYVAANSASTTAQALLASITIQ